MKVIHIGDATAIFFQADKTESHEDAILLYKHALRLQPDLDCAYVNMGNRYAALRNVHAAVNAYKSAIDIYPDNPEAYFNMGILYQETGNTVAAVHALHKALELSPDDPDIKARLAEVHHELALRYSA